MLLINKEMNNFISRQKGCKLAHTGFVENLKWLIYSSWPAYLSGCCYFLSLLNFWQPPFTSVTQNILGWSLPNFRTGRAMSSDEWPDLHFLIDRSMGIAMATNFWPNWWNWPTPASFVTLAFWNESEYCKVDGHWAY